MERTLSKFLKIKGNNTITKEQQALFKVPDFERGWCKRHGSIQLNEEDWTKAIVSLRNSKGKFRALQNKRVSKKQKLYVMKNANNKLKIGISVDPSKRVVQIKNASGIEVEIVKTWDCRIDAFIVEKSLHVLFEDSREIGEWFNMDADYAINKIDNTLKGLVK